MSLDKKENKKILRQKLKQKLSELSIIEIDRISLSLSNNLKSYISEYKIQNKINGISIGGFSPIANEPIWFKAFSPGDNANYSLVHMHDEVNISYHKVDFRDIISEIHGLKLDNKLIEKETYPDIILVPGLGFNKSLDRLGRGRGYFDSYLKSYKGIKIGLFFECQRVDSVFTEEHDEKLDLIITEKKIYKGKNK